MFPAPRTVVRRPRARRWTVLVGLGAVLFPAALAGQEPQRPAVFRSTVGMTRVKAAVLDEAGDPVRGLEAADFRVREDGEERPVEVVLDPVDYALDVALVLDFSLSIERDWSAPRARRAAHQFLDRLNAEDCVFLLPFHGRVGPGRWGAPEDPFLRDAIDHHEFADLTRLYDAILVGHDALDQRRPDSASAAAEELDETLYGTWMEPIRDASCGEPLSFEEAQQRRAALVVLTDGEDMGSLSSYSDALMATWRSEVPVFAVAVGLAAEAQSLRPSSWNGGRTLFRGSGSRRRLTRAAWENLRTLQDQLRELARVSGGQLVVQHDLEEGYGTTLGLLRGYYVLGYPSPEPAVEGWHALDVDLVGRRGDVIVQPGIYRTEENPIGAVGVLRDASVKFQLGQFEESLADFDRAASFSPDVGSPFFGRGLVLERLERWDEARDSYRRSLELRPGAPVTHSRLSEVAVQLDDLDGAWEHAIRAQLGGVDMQQMFRRLRTVSSGPDDLDARMGGPVVHLLKPRVPHLEAQMALRDVLRDLTAGLEASPPIALTGVAGAAGYTVNVWVRRINDKGEMLARLVVVERRSGRVHEKGFEIDDLNDAEEVRAATERALGDIRDWILERHSSR